MSEFGKGCAYCLGLFIAHEGRMALFEQEQKRLPRHLQDTLNYISIWFNTASDHLYELQIPSSLPEDIQERLRKFRDQCMGWRVRIGDKSPIPTKDKYDWAINEAKELLLLIDKHCVGVETEKGDFE